MTIPMPPQVKTIDKFGISARGNQGQGPLLQPKVKYRFRVLFLGFGASGNTAEPLTLNTNTCGIPSSNTEMKEIHSYNSVAYYAGKHTWDAIDLSVRDTVDNTVTKQVGLQLQRQMDHYNQTGYRAGQDYKFTMMIQMLDGGHDSANSTWTLEGCFLTKVSYGDLDYSSSDMMNISMNIRYDNAILEDQSGTNSIFGAVATDVLGTFINS